LAIDKGDLAKKKKEDELMLQRGRNQKEEATFTWRAGSIVEALRANA